MGRGTGRGLLVGLLLLSACRFDESVPESSVVACTAQGPACPEGRRCAVAIGRCVPEAELGREAPVLVEPAVTPALGNGATSFTATFGSSLPLAIPPRGFTTVRTREGRAVEVPLSCEPCAVGDACRCSVVIGATVEEALEDGPLRFRIELVGVAGQSGGAQLAGEAALDVTPPSRPNPAELRFIPNAPGALVVDALGPGVRLEACFDAPEPLSGAPNLWLATDSAPDSSLLAGAVLPGWPIGDRHCFVFAPTAASPLPPDGRYRLRARMVDVAGNVATVDLAPVLAPAVAPGTLRVDATPPSPPRLDGSGLRLLRQPWGALDAPGESRVQLEADQPVTSEPVTLQVWGDAARRRPLAQVVLGASTALAPIDLAVADLREAWVDALDTAGNAATGGPFLVAEGRWVATLAGKEAGDPFANPHACYGRSVHGPALEQADDGLTEQSAAQAPSGGGRAEVFGAATWRRRLYGSPRYETFSQERAFACALEPRRAQLVAYGTPDGQASTWSFDGAWRERTVGTQPGERYGMAMAHDLTKGRTLLVGGDPFGSGPYTRRFCDTWSWDGSLWRLLRPCAPTADGGIAEGDAPARTLAGLVHDPARNQLVLIGGADAPDALATTLWRFDGRDWTPLPDPPPGERFAPRAAVHAVAWPQPDGEVLLVAHAGLEPENEDGSFLSGRRIDETWFGRWDGTTYRWRAVHRVACAPFSLDGTCGEGFLAVDSETGDLALAENAPDADENGATDGVELREWDAEHSTWSVKVLLEEWIQPYALVRSASLAPGDSTYVVVGVDDDYEPAVSACDLKTGVCRRVSAASDDPGAIQDAALAFNPQGKGVFFGGRDATLGTATSRYLVWDGAAFSDDFFDPGTSELGPRAEVGLAWHPEDSAWWMWDHEGRGALLRFTYRSSYTPLSVPAALNLAATSPGKLLPIDGAGLGGRRGLLPYGGNGHVPVELLHPGTGGGPVSIETLGAEPPGSALAFDGAQGVLWSASGNGHIHRFLDDGGWEDRGTQLGALASYGSSGAWDARYGDVLWVGYEAVGNSAGGVVAWDGTNARTLRLDDPELDGRPATLAGAATAWDPVRHRFVVHGGSTLRSPRRETYELLRGDLRPAEVCRFRFGASGVSGRARIDRVRVRGRFAASWSGPAGGGSEPGRVELWRGGAWSTAGTCPADGCGLTGAPVELVGEGQTARSWIDPAGELGVALAPDRENGAGEAAVTSTALEVEIRYRLTATP